MPWLSPVKWYVIKQKLEDYIAALELKRTQWSKRLVIFFNVIFHTLLVVGSNPAKC